MAERSAWVNELARATPPNFPRATALGFFFVAMPYIISLSGKLVKEELLKFCAFPNHSVNFRASPFETDVAP